MPGATSSVPGKASSLTTLGTFGGRAGSANLYRLTAPGAGGGVPPNKGEKSGVATGKPETRIARDPLVVYLEVYRHDLIPYGNMSREQTSFLVKVKTAEGS